MLPAALLSYLPQWHWRSCGSCRRCALGSQIGRSSSGGRFARSVRQHFRARLHLNRARAGHSFHISHHEIHDRIDIGYQEVVLLGHFSGGIERNCLDCTGIEDLNLYGGRLLTPLELHATPDGNISGRGSPLSTRRARMSSIVSITSGVGAGLTFPSNRHEARPTR